VIRPDATDPTMTDASMTDVNGNPLTGVASRMIVLVPSGNLVDSGSVPGASFFALSGGARRNHPRSRSARGRHGSI